MSARNVNPDAVAEPKLGEGMAARAPETIMEVSEARVEERIREL